MNRGFNRRSDWWWSNTQRFRRSQTVKVVRYGRGGNKFRRCCYVAA